MKSAGILSLDPRIQGSPISPLNSSYSKVSDIPLLWPLEILSSIERSYSSKKPLKQGSVELPPPLFISINSNPPSSLSVIEISPSPLKPWHSPSMMHEGLPLANTMSSSQGKQ